MVKAIIFDLDKMVHLADGLFSEKIVKDYNISKEEISEFFKKEYKLCRIGKLDAKDALVPYIKQWKFPGSVEDFLEIWYDYGHFDQEMLALIKTLKEKRIKCVLVTNNEMNRIEYYQKELSVFDKVIASYMYGFCKPSPEIMDLIFDKLGFKRKDILFCDDKPEFIEVAKNYGFQTHLYTNIETFKKKLSELGLL